MLFRRIVLCALLVGALSGLVLSAVQRWHIIPLYTLARFQAGIAGPTGSDVQFAQNDFLDQRASLFGATQHFIH